MKIKLKIILMLASVFLVLICSPPGSEAALSSKYASPAASGNAAAAKPAEASMEKPAPPAQAKNEPTVRPPQPSTNQETTERVAFVSEKTFNAKQTELFKKEHETFCKAFVDAEMGLRYFYKTQYDAIHSGRRAPSDEELKAMRFELSLLMKDLGSSAKRYASNIRMAQLVMQNMDGDQKTLFAKTLSGFFVTPAYAFDASSLSGISAGFNSVANASSDVGFSSEADYARAAMSQANLAKAGEIIAAATSMVSTTILSGAAVVGGAALTMGAVTTGGAFLGGAMMVGSIVGGGLETATSVIGFIDALTEGETDLRHAKEVSVTINVINVAASIPASVRTIKVIVDMADATKDAWIPRILRETEDPNNPGMDGVNRVKSAQSSASSGGSGGGGGGG